MPRAKQNKIAEILKDGTVKIRLTAPPVEGKANKALIKFLADLLGLPKSKIEILSGASIRNKVLSIDGLDTSELLEKINGELKV